MGDAHVGPWHSFRIRRRRWQIRRAGHLYYLRGAPRSSWPSTPCLFPKTPSLRAQPRRALVEPPSVCSESGRPDSSEPLRNSFDAFSPSSSSLPSLRAACLDAKRLCSKLATLSSKSARPSSESATPHAESQRLCEVAGRIRLESREIRRGVRERARPRGGRDHRLRELEAWEGRLSGVTVTPGSSQRPSHESSKRARKEEPVSTNKNVRSTRSPSLLRCLQVSSACPRQRSARTCSHIC